MKNLSFPSVLLMVLALVLASCGPDQPASMNAGPRQPPAVLLISPDMPADVITEVAAEADTGIRALLSAHPGASLVVYDGYDARVVAEFTAGSGAPRVRLRQQARPMQKLRAFLQRPRAGGTRDSRIRLPLAVQGLASLRLPPGSVITILANPLFLDDRQYAAFSMAGGRVPSDGMILAPAAESLYSTVGLEDSLKGITLHWGYPREAAWKDDAHRVRVRRFWSVYIRSMGGVLATFQPGLPDAAEAARQGISDALLPDTADPADAPRMIEWQDAPPPPEVRTTAPPPVQQQTAAPVAVDRFGNPEGDVDLAAGGALRGRRLLILLMDRDPQMQASPAWAELRALGAEVTLMHYPLPPVARFSAALQQSHGIWLIASEEKDHLPATHRRAIADAWRSGRGLCLAGENAPFIHEPNQILAEICPGAGISGNHPAGAILSARTSPDSPGFDPAEPLFRGLFHLHEGRTVSAVQCAGGLRPVARGSSGHVLLALSPPSGGSGSLIVDTGHTRYWPACYHDTAGTARFVRNLATLIAAPAAPRTPADGRPG